MGSDQKKSSSRNILDIIVPIALVLWCAFLWYLQEHSQWDRIERKKQAWAELLSSHPYYNRPQRNAEEWNKIPASDRPDLAFELDFMKTMDPALGYVPYERLGVASKYMERLLKQRERAPIDGVTWEERGPKSVGGRTRVLMFDPNDTNHKKVWAGGVGGGLWWTADITASSPVWNKVDDFWDNIAVTTIAFNPNNTNEFYVGTGEGWFNQGWQSGSGIWKSTDGGLTWNKLSSTNPGGYLSGSHFVWIQKIVVKSDGTVFAATRGYFNNTGGIMRSENGGTSWTRVLSVNASNPLLKDRAADIEIAANGDVYASFGISSDGQVFKSINADNGDSGTWMDLSSNIVIGNAERIELACAPSDSSIIYAVARGLTGFNDIDWFKKSSDGGSTWSAITIPLLVDDTATHFTRGQAYYDLILAVHPTDTNFVIAGGIDVHRTTDGGTTWSWISHFAGGFSLPYVHADQHAIMFRPGASDEVLFGNDGGVAFSVDAGDSGSSPTFSGKNSGYNVTQFYTCAARNEVNSQYFLAGSQDNGTQKFTEPHLGNTTQALGGDGGFCHIDQNDPNIQLIAYILNNVYRSLDGGHSFAALFTENSGLFINPSAYDSDRKILYAARNNNELKRVTNIDATITNTNSFISVGNVKVSALKVSPYNDMLILGIMNARVYRYSNASTGSPTLTRIDNGTNPILTSAVVSSIDMGADTNHILVTYSSYGVTSVWETTDGGDHWYSKEGNLPDMPVRWGIYNPDNRDEVMLATELGVWSTDNFQPGTSNAPTWGPSNEGLAHTRCDMLQYRPADNMVIIATHGRGLFTSDIFVTTSVADFVYDSNTSCSGSLTVDFTDASLKPNNSWAWDIDNNGTTDYTAQNPTHTYSSAGMYSVRLTINSGDTSTTKQDVILVMSSEPTINTGCTLSVNSNVGNPYGYGIFRFALGMIDHATSYNDGYYQNYACDKWTPLELNTTYDITIRTGTANNEGASVYIDYDNNGTFETDEEIATFPANMDGTRTLSFTTPATDVVMDTGLRMRVLSKDMAVPSDGCDIGMYGQAEDYTVFFSGCEIVVDQVSGSGAGSLPAAVNCASSGDTIRLSASLAGQTIHIGVDSLSLDKNLVILGESANTGITGSGAKVFELSSAVQVELSTLIMIAGTSTSAGAIYNSGILKLDSVVIQQNPNIMGATLIQNTPGAQLKFSKHCVIEK